MDSALLTSLQQKSEQEATHETPQDAPAAPLHIPVCCLALLHHVPAGVRDGLEDAEKHS